MRFFSLLVLALFLSAEAFQPTYTKIGQSFRTTQSYSRLSMAADPGTKKETFVDRLTGPKLFKTVTNWNGIHSVPLVPLRILTGLLMIHHGSEGAFVV